MNSHSKNIGRDCAKRAQAKYGAGWAYLSEEQQKGAVALEVVSVLLAQAAQPNQSTQVKSDSLIHCQDVARSALYPQ